MTFTIDFGWWLLPLALTIAAWVPLLRYEPTRGGYLPDMGGAFIALMSLVGTLFVWMVYFGIGWALA
ncbi:hypothetical protein [Sphingopyxis sp. SCN 67-31]|mgnify:CR=1 FL=1|uniref:hypothetical protein n=1 Tax=Sphingopyxis sp. SCN 67-31 TaxID=1660142 RepID=UPI00257D42B3|nr:hypothetical protein [Sphingopyxis sp. SCN 67-31]